MKHSLKLHLFWGDGTSVTVILCRSRNNLQESSLPFHMKVPEVELEVSVLTNILRHILGAWDWVGVPPEKRAYILTKINEIDHSKSWVFVIFTKACSSS